MFEDLKFCPRCADAMEVRHAGHPPSPQPVCTECGFVLWQNLKPSVEALIVRGDGPTLEVLLGRRTTADGRVAWDMPGGFLNSDDRIRTALQRECKREMGVEVDIVELLGAFEDDFHGSRIVCLVYVCRVAAGEPRAADIIDDVRWFSMAEAIEPASPAVAEALEVLGRWSDR
jgi:ADP-ribose pyrophosphatase YjhB (NUDIX family)